MIEFKDFSSITYKERCELQFEMKLKKIKSRDLARLLEVSDSWISQFFNNKVNLPEKDIERILNYVQTKEL